jgi:hypothetical protein
MKRAFISANLRGTKRAVIRQANEIIESYQVQGFKMTLRQLYYQFVSRDLLANTEQNYKRIAQTISDGRLAGLVDWGAIEDRGRVADQPYYYESPADALKTIRSVAQNYVTDRWATQDTYVELWVEKQALAGVLEPLARRFQITLMVNKGYSSSSAMFDSAARIRRNMGTFGEPLVPEPVYGQESETDYSEIGSDREGVVLYLGDHDPSGEDMVRDIRDRLKILGADSERLTVQKVALTMPQIRQYVPPPNPAKITDPRAREYIAQHGPHSWEVDALNPTILARLVSNAVAQYQDQDALDLTLKREETDRNNLIKQLERIKT